MGYRYVAFAFACFLFFGCRTTKKAETESEVLGAGSEQLWACIGNRSFQREFDFNAKDFTMKNAYWMAALSYNIYSRKETVVPEMVRYGFPQGAPASGHEVSFFSQDASAKTIIGTIRYADTQGLWAENDNGVLLGFRGSELNDAADFITDLMKSHTDPTQEVVGVADEIPEFDEHLSQNEKEIRIHTGMWVSLGLIWKDIELRAKALYARERPKEIAAKMAKLDSLAKLTSPALLDQELNKITEWVAPLEGKRNIIKKWKELPAKDAVKRKDFFVFFDSKWGSWQKPIWITGHSLGGGLAAVAAFRLYRMGLNVKGLYTFGAPRAGNKAFVHDLRVRAFENGTILKGKEGNFVRFVNHLDIVARIPPLTALEIAVGGSSNLNPLTDWWKHYAYMKYLTSDETDKPELWEERTLGFSKKLEDFNGGKEIIQYSVFMPLDRRTEMMNDHDPEAYFRKIETLAYGQNIKCSGPKNSMFNSKKLSAPIITKD